MADTYFYDTDSDARPTGEEQILADSDEAYESGAYETSTTSLSESVHAYIYEHGRRYHTHGGLDRVLFPTDEQEQDRLDVLHELMLTLLDRKLYTAPIGPSPQRILDVGTGTGIWAIDMADEFPSAEVTGTDLSPIQSSMVPPNCRFEIDDAEKEWTYKPDLFDFVHIRNVAQSIGKWKEMLAEAYRCIAPGGYIELSELGCVARCDDGTLDKDDPLVTFMDLLSDTLEEMGRPQPSIPFLRGALEEAGFEGIVAKSIKFPYGPWPKDYKLKSVGRIMLFAIISGQAFHACGMAPLTRFRGMTNIQAEQMCDAAMAAVKDSRRHSYNICCVLYARKPGGTRPEDGR